MCTTPQGDHQAAACAVQQLQTFGGSRDEGIARTTPQDNTRRLHVQCNSLGQQPTPSRLKQGQSNAAEPSQPHQAPV